MISADRRHEHHRAAAAVAYVKSRLAMHPELALLPFLLVFVAVPLLAPANSNLYDDEAGYVGLAKYLSAGHYLSGRDDLVGGGPAYPNLWFGPGLPLVLTPFVALHLPLTVIRLLGPVFLFGAVVLFYRLLRLAVPEKSALVGAAALGLYVPLYTVIAFVHSEALAVLLVVAAMYATALYLRDGRRLQLFAAAGSLAWLALTRIAFGWVLAILLGAYLLAWAVRRSQALRRLVVVQVLALALCTPWLAYTYSVTGKGFYWGSSGALSLYWMSSPYSGDRGDWHGADSVFEDASLAPHRPFFRSLAGLDLNAQNSKLEHAAVSNIRHHPFKFVRNVVDNVSRMVFNTPYSFKGPKPTTLVYAIPGGLLIAGLLASMVRALLRRRALPIEASALGAFAAATIALHAVLSGYPRLLLPIVPVAIWLVVVCWSPKPAGGVRV
ncbi:MAG: hypothetical protein ABI990_00250 [Actinomycetota bacterium]